MIAMLKQYKYFVFALVLVLLDQLTKILVKGFTLLGFSHKGMYLGESFSVIGETVRCTFVENPGMAFGISWGDGKLYLTLLTIAVAGFLVWYLYSLRTQHAGVQTSVMLILAGAVGNLIDRMFYGVWYSEQPLFHGKVVDFIQVDIPDVDWMGVTYTHFPVFNVADSCVSVGIVLLLIMSRKMPKHVISQQDVNEH
jgi:signal peptidase II